MINDIFVNAIYVKEGLPRLKYKTLVSSKDVILFFIYFLCVFVMFFPL